MRMDDTLTDVSYLMFGVFMMLRMRGVWGGSWIPVILIGILTPIRPIISMYLQIHYTTIAFGEPLYGCGSVFSVDQTVYTRCVLQVRRLCTLLSSELTVLPIQFGYCVEGNRDCHRCHRTDPDLV
ncbi:hypothetical protein C8Q74DRAFT_1297303, partial [Fomes fomentarius]